MLLSHIASIPLLLTPSIGEIPISQPVSTVSPQETEDEIDLGAFRVRIQQQFIPIDPIPARNLVEVPVGDNIEQKDIRLLSKPEYQFLFGVTDVSVRLAKVDTSGKLTYLTGSVTAEKGSYVAFMDYMNYHQDDLIDPDSGAVIGKAKVGIGLRFQASIKTSRKGLDLSSLFKIGFAANRDHLSGSLQIRAIGANSTEIQNLLPSNLKDIDDSGVQSALEAMAAVKAKIYEEDTQINPHVLAVAYNTSDIAQIRRSRLARPAAPDSLSDGRPALEGGGSSSGQGDGAIPLRAPRM